MNSFVDQASAASQEIIKRVESLARQKDLPMAVIALSYCLHRDILPVVGLNDRSRIDESLQAISCRLTDAELLRLEEPYVPQPIRGFQ